MGTKSQVTPLPLYKRHKLWKLRRARGIATMVPSAPIADHLQWLVDMGFTDGSIGAAAGLPQRTVWLVRGRTYDKTRLEQATRLMSVTHVPVPAQSTLFVSALGVRRRIHALQAIGYGYRELGDQARIRPESFRRFTDVQQVLGRNWFLVSDLYDQLSGTPGPSRLSETRARKRELQPPLAWEGLDIDHPDHTPTLLPTNSDSELDEVLLDRIIRGHHTGKVQEPERTALLDHAIAHGWTGSRVAEALGVKPDTGEQALVRRKAKLRKTAA